MRASLQDSVFRKLAKPWLLNKPLHSQIDICVKIKHISLSCYFLSFTLSCLEFLGILFPKHLQLIASHKSIKKKSYENIKYQKSIKKIFSLKSTESENIVLIKQLGTNFHVFQIFRQRNSKTRSSRQYVIWKRGIYKSFVKFTGDSASESLVDKVASLRLRLRCCPVNLAKSFRTYNAENTSGGLIR